MSNNKKSGLSDKEPNGDEKNQVKKSKNKDKQS
jgi:hypothetical protein